MNRCFLLFASCVIIASDSKTTRERLLDDLFSAQNYNKYAMPGTGTEPIKVRVALLPHNIIQLDEKSQTLEMSLEFSLLWTDERLQWNSSNYDDISTIYYPQSQLWLPPLGYINVVSKRHQAGYDESLVSIFNTNISNMQWLMFEHVVFSCDIDVTFYPFDTQECALYVSFSPMVLKDLDASPDEVYTINPLYFDTGGSWETQDLQCHFAVLNFAYAGTTQFQFIKYVFVLRRLTTFYVLNIVLPVVFLSITASVVFVLPAESGEKMGVSLTVLLAYSVYLSIIADDLPQTSRKICYLQVYLTSLLGITAFAVLLSVLVLHLHHMAAHIEVGEETKQAVRCLRKIIGLEKNRHSRTAAVHPLDVKEKCHNSFIGNQPTEDIPGNKSNVSGAATSEEDKQSREYVTETSIAETDDVTWVDVAQTIDRVIFIVLSVIIVVGSVLTFAYISSNGSQSKSGSVFENITCSQSVTDTVRF